MRALASLLLAAVSVPAWGQGELTRALQDEMHRTMTRLEMEGRGKSYFVSYTVQDSSGVTLMAGFGGLKEPVYNRGRQLRVDLRLGGPAFDNSNYVGKDYWRYRPFTTGMAIDDDYDALRFSVWSQTDEAYKYAVQKLSEKTAYKHARLIEEEVPDLSKEEVRLEEILPEPIAFNRSAWETRLQELSAVFKEHPKLQSSWAWLSLQSMQRRYVDSEGRRFSRPAPDDCQLVIAAHSQAKDGLPIGDQLTYVRQSADLMPPQEVVMADARRLAKEVSAMVDAATLDSYIGPVLLEGEAAAEFFNQLLVRNVSSPRSPWFEDEGVKKDYQGGGLLPRLGQRVASPGLNAEDDPLLTEYEGTPLAGHYSVDDEGIPARKVSLVEKGLLKDVLMSRAPIKERANSNGHGRAGFREWTSGRPGNVLIRVEGAISAVQLKAELLRRAAEFGLEYGIVVRRIEGEDSKEEGELLAPPVRLFKIYVKDGREEPLRNMEFSGVTLRALRDIAAASAEKTVYNYYQQGPYRHQNGNVLASIVTPSVLLTEMELKKTKKKPEKLPYLKHPYFD